MNANTNFDPLIHGYQFRNSFRLELKYNLPLIGEIDIEDIVIGLCGGMCFSALDHYYAGEQITSRTTTPGSGTALRKHLVSKQIQSLIPPDGIVKVLHWTARENDFVWRHTAGREFGKLRTRINRGEPTVLALIRAGKGEDPTRNHQVIAHSYDYHEQSGRVRLGIYDPNHPGKTPILSFNTALTSTGINAKQSNDVPFRGFFLIQYR